MSSMSPLRRFMLSTTVLENSSSTSIVTSSIGSIRLPASSVWKSTRGRETVISNPSRRICSIRTPSCNSPRPPISKASFELLSANVMATFVSASTSSLSRITVEVTFLPSRPANGESFTVIVTDIVGGSMGVDDRGSMISGVPIVSDTDALVRPATQIMSPALTSLTGTRCVPSKRNSFVRRPVSTVSPSRLIARTDALTLVAP